MDSVLIAVLLKLFTQCFCRVTASMKKKSDKTNFITGGADIHNNFLQIADFYMHKIKT